MTNKEITTSEVSKRIYVIRGMQVMLDSDLAEIYDVGTKRLKEAVKRNIKRFPHDFMFKLNSSEWEFLRSQIATSNFKQRLSGRGGNRFLPSVFTEAGVDNDLVCISQNRGCIRRQSRNSKRDQLCSMGNWAVLK